ncbi:hypothetical protein B566_EDAN006278 [Ephemera danica]|nr:hypothetical protein B566_EDAN006278 [Ephemera danica]
MSSYQFVNSLASCYNGPGQRSQGGHQDTIAAVAAVHAAANTSAAADYYNANNYPANCYSPQVSPHYGPYAPAATPQSHHNLTQGGNASDYNPTHQHAVAAAAAAAHQRLQSATSLTNTSPGAPTPPSATPVSSCKYADSTASSPQDLSTSSGNTPAPQQSRSPAEAVNPISSGTAQNQATTPSSNTAASANPSQQSSSSSSGASSNNSSGAASGKSGNSGNPPQIYPWMKRVHLGQIKLSK